MAPSPEPAGLLASRLLLAVDSGVTPVVAAAAETGDGVFMGEAVEGPATLAGLCASRASSNRHLTSSAYQIYNFQDENTIETKHV